MNRFCFPIAKLPPSWSHKCVLNTDSLITCFACTLTHGLLKIKIYLYYSSFGWFWWQLRHSFICLLFRFSASCKILSTKQCVLPPFHLHPQIVYWLLSFLFLFFIWCHFVVLKRQYQVFFLLKKRKVQEKGFIYFDFCLKKCPTLRVPQNFIWCT